ncbi:MAG: hypothetical protein M3P06_02875 [Acidobacteriota bacterium]|nr:hypothetical protein [Acidobacteriota bacterium]
MDLAVQEEGETSVESVEPGEAFTVTILNRMPNGRYTVKFERRREVLEPLNLSTFRSAGDPASDCASVVPHFQADLANADDEQHVAAIVSDARIKAAGCSAAIVAQVEAVIEQRTEFPPRAYPKGLSRGESLVVTVTRGAGTDQKKWILEITTGRSGEWRVLYGFNYVPDDDDHFFLRENTTTAGTYDIVEERGDNDFSFVPTIFASWQANRPGPLSWGLSGGMGFDTDKPVIFVGPSVIFRQNISLNLGLVMKERRRLDPQLDRTKPLPALLDNEKLYRTDGYRPNWFIGIGFRFDANPFKGGEDPAPEEEE